MEIATVRKVNDSEMRAPAGILCFAAQQAETCQGMQGRQWERDALTRNEQKEEAQRKRICQKISKGNESVWGFCFFSFQFNHRVPKTLKSPFQNIKEMTQISCDVSERSTNINLFIYFYR